MHFVVHSNAKCFACKYCDKTFNWKTQLVTHEHTHTGTGLYFCPICDKSFSTKWLLTRHVKIHTRIMEDNEYLAYKALNGESIEMEQSIDSSMDDTLNQIEVSSGEEDNNKENKLKSPNISDGMSTPVKKHKCKDCDKQFQWVHELAKHILVHLTETNIQCPGCGKCFSRMGSMRAHTLQCPQFREKSDTDGTSLFRSEAQTSPPEMLKSSMLTTKSPMQKKVSIQKQVKASQRKQTAPKKNDTYTSNSLASLSALVDSFNVSEAMRMQYNKFNISPQQTNGTDMTKDNMTHHEPENSHISFSDVQVKQEPTEQESNGTGCISPAGNDEALESSPDANVPPMSRIKPYLIVPEPRTSRSSPDSTQHGVSSGSIPESNWYNAQSSRSNNRRSHSQRGSGGNVENSGDGSSGFPGWPYQSTPSSSAGNLHTMMYQLPGWLHHTMASQLQLQTQQLGLMVRLQHQQLMKQLSEQHKQQTEVMEDQSKSYRAQITRLEDRVTHLETVISMQTSLIQSLTVKTENV